MPPTESIRAIARTCGYAVGEHGSRLRDLDLIAVPWSEEAVSADELVATIIAKTNYFLERQIEKPYGRRGFILFPKSWRTRYDRQPGRPVRAVDISVTPRAIAWR